MTVMHGAKKCVLSSIMSFLVADDLRVCVNLFLRANGSNQAWSYRAQPILTALPFFFSFSASRG
jgi:hypothetical protein